MKFLGRETLLNRKYSLKIVSILSFLLLTIQINAAETESMFGRFNLTIKEYVPNRIDERKISIRQYIEGNITQRLKEDQVEYYIISVEKYKVDIERKYKNPDVDIPSFDLQIIPDKEINSLVFKILSGEDPNLMVRNMQYRLGVTIFEMAMLDVISEEYITTGDQSVVLKTKGYDNYKIKNARAGIRSLIGGVKTTTFKILPMFRSDNRITCILYDLKNSPYTLEYCTREKFIQTGRIIHAINLECAFNEPSSDKDINDILRNLHELEKFKSYHLYELTIQ